MKRGLILLIAIAMIVAISLGSMENQLVEKDKYASQVDRAGPETLLTSSTPVNIPAVEGMDMGIALMSVTSSEFAAYENAAVAVEANYDQIGSQGLQGYSLEGSSLPLKTLMTSGAANAENNFANSDANKVAVVVNAKTSFTRPESNLNSLQT